MLNLIFKPEDFFLVCSDSLLWWEFSSRWSTSKLSQKRGNWKLQEFLEQRLGVWNYWQLFWLTSLHSEWTECFLWFQEILNKRTILIHGQCCYCGRKPGSAFILNTLVSSQQQRNMLPRVNKLMRTFVHMWKYEDNEVCV